MIARKHRLDLRHTPGFFQQCEHFFTPSQTYFYNYDKSKADSPGKVAIIIPKKAVRVSVTRHFYKRIIAKMWQIQPPDNLELAIIITKKFGQITTPELKKKALAQDWQRFLYHLEKIAPQK